MKKQKAIAILTAHLISMKNCIHAPVTYNDSTIKAFEMAIEALKKEERYTDSTDEKIANLYEAGYSIHQIADKCNVDRQDVRDALERISNS